MGGGLALAGDPAALAVLERAAKTSKDPDIFFRLGWLLAHQGDRWGACAAWEGGAQKLGAWVLLDSARQLKCGMVTLPMHRASVPVAPPPSPVPAELDRVPSLQNTCPTASTIVWRTDVESTGEVRWGDSPENLDRTTPSDATARQHEVVLTGLSPDSRTFYAV
jgi:hypothetical protein